MGRTAVNFTFDVSDVDKNTSSKNTLDWVAGGIRVLAPSNEYGVFGYESNTYVVPAGKRLVFRVIFDMPKLYNISTNDGATSLWEIITNLGGFNMCFIHINDIWASSKNINAMYLASAPTSVNSIENSYSTPILIAGPGQKIQLGFKPKPSGDDPYPILDSIKTVSAAISAEWCNRPIFRIDKTIFDNSTQWLESKLILDTMSNVEDHPINNHLYRKGTPKVAFLNGFLEDDI